jgi:hypothetical protein
MIRTGTFYDFSFRQFFRRASLLSAAVALALMLQPRIGHANDTTDFVVDAVAAAGGIAGVPIRESEKDFVKQLVGDIASGTRIDVAMKNAVMRPLIEQLPAEARAAANCIAGGTSLAQCAAREFKNAPEVLQCVADGTALATCAQREAIRQLPQEVRNAADCVTSREKVAECAKGQAREIIGKLENAARDEADKKFKAAPSAIQNIMNIVDGYQRKDWAAVLENGGAAFAKVIIQRVLAKLLPGPTYALAEPMISVAVENRIGLAGDLVRAAENGEPATVARVLFEGFLTFQFEMQCSLPIIPQAVRDAVCGPLGDVIRVLGGAVGSFTADVLALIAGAIKDPLGLPGAVVDILIDPFDGLEKDCGAAEGYYARRFATCYPLAASQKLTSHQEFDKLEGALNLQCRHYFARCFNSTDDKYGKICNPLSNTYKAHAQAMETALRNSAETYKRDLRGYIQSKGAGSCGAGFADLEYEIFISQCGDALSKQMPLGIPVGSNFPENAKVMNGPNDPAPNCTRRPDERNMLSGSADSVGQIACRQSVSQREFEQVAKQVCKEQVITLTPENIPPPKPTTNFQPQHNIAISKVALPTPPPNTNNLRPQHNTAITIVERGQAAPNVNTGGAYPARPIVPANADVPRNNVRSGTALACPPGAVYFNGSCNSGGADGAQRGGTSYDRIGRPITPPTANPVRSGTAVARGCPPDNPVGKYPNCCPRYMTPDGRGGCSGVTTAHPDGTSYGPSGRPIPSSPRNNVPSGTAVARGCPADSPVGVYPNCCPRYMTPDGRGGCSGVSTVQPGGTPVQGGGNTVKLSTGNTTVGPVAKPAVTAINPGIVPKDEPKKFRLRTMRTQPATTPPRESLVK